MTSIRIAALTVLVAVLLTGCGIRPSGYIDAGDPPDGMAVPVHTTLFLLEGQRLVKVQRPGLQSHPWLALELLTGPITRQEYRAGLRNAITQQSLWAPEDHPGETKEEYLSVSPLTDAKWSREALAQLACTVEAMPNANGRKALLTSASDFRKPKLRLSCADYSDLR